ncbi:hypothetical protein DNTS_024021 [Danionella cerebrum]|uniref:C2H2-type domain-containing protein n=1 Tax=Danionella cerebrum TaxID=2873325 RepID=A0A553R282_9TELE|nr:hypothetical protein DNTS_024021 [Danionella translucida]
MLQTQRAEHHTLPPFLLCSRIILCGHFPFHFNFLIMAMHDMNRAKGFPCKECDLICPSTPSLLEHMKAHYHQEENGRFECEHCGRIFKHDSSLASHKKTHEMGSFQCPVCTRTLPNALALKNHLRIHTLSPNTQVEVEEEHEENVDGDRDYNLAQDLSEAAFRSHLSTSGMMSVHEDDKHKTSTSEDAWDRPFKCDQCDRTYRHHGSLVNHKKCHQEGTYKCSVCYKTFNNLAALNGHERTHSKFKPPGLSLVLGGQSDPRPLGSQNDDIAPSYCHLCQMAFSNKNDFQEHLLLHNAASSSLGLTRSLQGIVPHNLSTVRSSAVNPYTPPLGDPLPLPALPDKRYDPILGPPVNSSVYTCAYCGSGHPDVDSLKLHYLTHDPHTTHTQDPPGILDPDGLTSSSQSPVSSSNDQRRSQEQSSPVNDEERRFKCQECGKSYRHAGSLVNHKRSHQTGQYQCTVCCKEYPHLAALNSHLRSHKTRPNSQSMGSDGDWLSSEPLTGMDSQQGFVDESSTTNPISLPGNLGDTAHFVQDVSHNGGLESLEFHDRFEGALTQSSSGHSPLPQSNRQTDRPNQVNLTNGYLSNMSFHSSSSASLPSGSGNIKGSPRQRRGDEQMPFGSAQGNSQGNSKTMEHKDDDDDGEIYQCTVCGNHYASLRALRSHFRSHEVNQEAGPSSPLTGVGGQEWRRQQEGSTAGLLNCSTCGQGFSRKQDLLNHQLAHGSTRSDGLTQGLVGSSSNSNGKMDGRNHICVDCGMFFADRHHLITHLCPGKARAGGLNKGLNGAKGMTGGAGTSSSGGPLNSRQVSTSDDRPHRCDQCGRGYRHPCSLLNHKKSHKTGVFRCLVCQKRYYNLLALKNHQRTHFDLKRHKCEECGKAFKIQKQLLNHLRLHEEHRAKTGDRSQGVQSMSHPNGGHYQGGPSHLQPMRMADPKMQTPQMNTSYDQHQDFKKPYAGARAQQVDDGSGRRPFACDQCGRTYRHAGSLANHKNLHKIGEYHCNVCNSTYPNRLAMKNHLRMHFALKKYTCADCGRGFRNQRQLETHTSNQLCKDLPGPIPSSIQGPITNPISGPMPGPMSGPIPGPSIHSAPQPEYECDGCTQIFHTTTDLATHNCSAHLPSSSASLNSSNMSMETSDLGSPEREERPFTCDLCGCSYKHASSLLNHKNTHKVGNFNCSYCDKPYTNYMALRNHMRIHTQKKRHICTTCGKAFRLARFLRNHQRVHEEGHTRFGCPTCGKSFQGRSGLARHRCGDNQVGTEEMRKDTSSTREDYRFTYMISNPASSGPYACRNLDFSEVWTV